jgi:hypothetical protein
VVSLRLKNLRILSRVNMPKAFWDKPNPKKKSTPLTAAQKAAAKKRAKAAGRPYPNLVDNAFAGKKKF